MDTTSLKVDADPFESVLLLALVACVADLGC
jgi:hypothetical protein